MSDSYNEMVLETPYEEEEEAIDEQYIDKNIDMDDIVQPSPITTGNTASTPNPPTMEEANENHLLALLTLSKNSEKIGRGRPPQCKYYTYATYTYLHMYDYTCLPLLYITYN